ncbi:MAG: hypothetical protein B6D70_00690 [gamma proteobacterium symbiont of Stewartia floridana]|uniref:Uncharacterized protein n=1 Tax=Candidatus Thiodiazotropha taylori TaxID=2792791 RepID=A0A9E4U1M4_9GAMM|nr:hypothetical protein [Candidatus Thiodiazotropha taylori]MBW9258546.1 hypothetical protein [Candidatus Thiodiazotropha sp. (ex. Lucinisca nassula)]MCG7962675.1 hypothetical protein [Candidatus Thiodiazotropha endolucinida]MCG8015840.1 hypothetical protein [Candidatus Thiodiazotropha sp. 'RUGA']RLW54326.1 MAG: hypothetical protein B6D76_08030 [gamma proteobacterium symbiont of Stewartia floridana]
MFTFNEDEGWQVNADQQLITHQNGFKAEYKGNCIYGIKHFPIEATIHDIRNMVSKAEEFLSRL